MRRTNVERIQHVGWVVRIDNADLALTMRGAADPNQTGIFPFEMPELLHVFHFALKWEFFKTVDPLRSPSRH